MELKELGFDEPTLYHWHNSCKTHPFTNEVFNLNCRPRTNSAIKSIGEENHVWSAPIFSQAFKFFREKYNSHHSITRLPQGALDADSKNNKVLKKYAWFISKDDLNPTIPNDGSGKCDTYEEAELACLRKLIKIVKDEIQTD